MYLEIQIYIFKLKLTSNFGTKTKNEKPRIVTYQNPGERQCVLPSSKLKEKKKTSLFKCTNQVSLFFQPRVWVSLYQKR